VGIVLCPLFLAAGSEVSTLGADYPGLYRARRGLRAAAEANEVRSLDEFLCPGEPDLAELAAAGADEGPFPPERWFAPAEGVAAVRGLAAFLRRRPRAIPRQAAVLAELAGLAAELAACQPGVGST
jgi:hypothetical protein